VAGGTGGEAAVAGGGACMMRLYFVWRFLYSLVVFLFTALCMILMAPVFAWRMAREDVRMKEILG